MGSSLTQFALFIIVVSITSIMLSCVQCKLSLSDMEAILLFFSSPNGFYLYPVYYTSGGLSSDVLKDTNYTKDYTILRIFD